MMAPPTKMMSGNDSADAMPKAWGPPSFRSRAGMDRRRAPRYPARTGAVAILRARPMPMGDLMQLSHAQIAMNVFAGRPERHGQIIDIGPGGLSFRYLPTGRGSPGPLVLDLLFSEKRIYLSNLSYRLVTDRRVPENLPVRALPLGQIHLQFLAPGKIQRADLATYLRHVRTGFHTV
jgi:hypothetical protein